MSDDRDRHGMHDSRDPGAPRPPRRLQTGLMWAAVVALTALPLLWVGHGPVDDTGTAGELFEGADSRAQQAITRIAPDYKPWFSPVLEPSSNEIASLLFALQAALGAGVIGYWLGVSKAQAKARAAADTVASRPPSTST
jgi:cobalt/nickel transport protein